jgi:hypothetical protein
MQLVSSLGNDSKSAKFIWILRRNVETVNQIILLQALAGTTGQLNLLASEHILNNLALLAQKGAHDTIAHARVALVASVGASHSLLTLADTAVLLRTQVGNSGQRDAAASATHTLGQLLGVLEHKLASSHTNPNRRRVRPFFSLFFSLLFFSRSHASDQTAARRQWLS